MLRFGLNVRVLDRPKKDDIVVRGRRTMTIKVKVMVVRLLLLLLRACVCRVSLEAKAHPNPLELTSVVFLGAPLFLRLRGPLFTVS